MSLWDRVGVGGHDDCWLFSGTVVRGYGQIRVGRKRHYAHRLAYELANGPFDSSLDVLHSCDTPLCCNPSHLRVGTQKENTLEMIAKRRHAFGERNGNAKLTEAQVRQIRSSRETHVALGRRFGLSAQRIGEIRSGKAWRYSKTETGLAL